MKKIAAKGLLSQLDQIWQRVIQLFGLVLLVARQQNTVLHAAR